MKITVLGSGGWLPLNKKTSSFLVEYQNTLLMIDAGSGILNLDHLKETLSKYNEVHIILTHYHLDHIMGLTYLDLYFKSDVKINIYAPGGNYYKEGPIKILNDFMNSPYTPKSINQRFLAANIYEYEEKSFKINNIMISPKVQIHTDYSFSIDIDNVFLYKTDTEFDLDIHLTFKNDYSYIFVECWGYEIEKTIGHTYFKQLISIKEKINPKTKLVLIHMNPYLSVKSVNEIKKNLKLINGFIASDLDVFNI